MWDIDVKSLAILTQAADVRIVQDLVGLAAAADFVEKIPIAFMRGNQS